LTVTLNGQIPECVRLAGASATVHDLIVNSQQPICYLLDGNKRFAKDFRRITLCPVAIRSNNVLKVVLSDFVCIRLCPFVMVYAHRGDVTPDCPAPRDAASSQPGGRAEPASPNAGELGVGRLCHS
jgi:hypothetical protein